LYGIHSTLNDSTEPKLRGLPEESKQEVIATVALQIANQYTGNNTTAENILTMHKTGMDEYVVDDAYLIHDGTKRSTGYSCRLKRKPGGYDSDATDWQCTEFYMDGKRVK